MSVSIDDYKEDLSKLLAMGERMTRDLLFKDAESRKSFQETVKKIKRGAGYQKKKEEVDGCFEGDYQRWYTESLAVIRQLIPDRLGEFVHLYQGDRRRKKVDATTYTIQDWLLGMRSTRDYDGVKHFDDIGCAAERFDTQFHILKAAESRFESTLHDLRQIAQADLFDSELDAARELLKNGFLRGAGAIAGVVLEKHLSEVCLNHSLKSRKKNPAISDFNELLKKNDVLDIPNWRFIQRLGDLRNLCDHNKEREPSKDEVGELISGVDKVSKTIY